MGCWEVLDCLRTTGMRFLFRVFGATRDRIERSLRLSKAMGREDKEPMKQTVNL